MDTPRTRRCPGCRRPVVRFVDEIGQKLTVDVTPVSVLEQIDDEPVGRLWVFHGTRVGWSLYWPPRTWRPVHRVHVCTGL